MDVLTNLISLVEIACKECTIGNPIECKSCSVFIYSDEVMRTLRRVLRRLVSVACSKCGDPSQGYAEKCKSCEVLTLEKSIVQQLEKDEAKWLQTNKSTTG